MTARTRIEVAGAWAAQHVHALTAGVRHACVNAGAPVPRRSRSRPATNRLVVANSCVAKCEVVHAPLARRRSSESAQDYVRHPLAGQDVAPYDSGTARRVQERALGDANRDGCQASLIQWDVTPHKAAKAVDNS